MLDSQVTDLLLQNEVSFEEIVIPLADDQKPIRNLEALLQAQDRNPESVVRSILFKTSTDDFILLAVAGGGRANWAVLRKHLNVKKLRMADYNEVDQATGYPVGAVPPIALPETLTVLVDNSISQFDEVIIGSGVLGYAISLASRDLLSLLKNADRGDFIKE